jgi:hypothetical protein
VDNRWHSDRECAMMSKISQNTRYSNSVSHWLTAARTLAIETTSPLDFSHLIGLENHLDRRKECEVMRRNKDKVVPPIKEMFGEDVGQKAECLILNIGF